MAKLGYLPSESEQAALEGRRQDVLKRFRELGTLAYNQEQADRAALQRQIDEIAREKRRAERKAKRSGWLSLAGSALGGLAGAGIGSLIPGGTAIGAMMGAQLGGGVGRAAGGGGPEGLDAGLQNAAMMYAAKYGKPEVPATPGATGAPGYGPNQEFVGPPNPYAPASEIRVGHIGQDLTAEELQRRNQLRQQLGLNTNDPFEGI